MSRSAPPYETPEEGPDLDLVFIFIMADWNTTLQRFFWP